MPEVATVEPVRERPQVEDLLRAREARGLRWAIIGRLVLITLAALMLPVTSPTVANTVYTVFLLALGVSICSAGYWLAQREKRLSLVGWMCVSFDVFTLFTLPISWYQAVGGPAMSRGFLLKNDLILLCLILIAVNGLAMRPVYPLVLTGASFVLYAILFVYASEDPRLVIARDIPEAVMGPTVHPGFFGWKLLTIGLIGGFFAWLARASHQTIRDAVELEHANEEMRRQHSELVMQGRLSALAGLVAGLAHEINTPLGAVLSSVKTVENWAGRISSTSDPGPEALSGGNDRVRALLAENVRTARQATQRIGAVVGRLKEFAGLDQSEVQVTHLETALDRTLDLIGPEVKGAAQVERDYAPTPPLKCRPKEINQVFFTLLTNAFQAMDRSGTLRIKTSQADSRVTVEISDTGPGIAAEQLTKLFEIGFAAKQGRMGMRLGLPMARYIIERHGGSIAVESRPGRGTTFHIALPAN